MNTSENPENVQGNPQGSLYSQFDDNERKQKKLLISIPSFHITVSYDIHTLFFYSFVWANVHCIQ